MNAIREREVIKRELTKAQYSQCAIIPPDHVPSPPPRDVQEVPDAALILVRFTPRTQDRLGRSWREQAQSAIKRHWRDVGAAVVDYADVTVEQGHEAIQIARMVKGGVAHTQPIHGKGEGQGAGGTDGH